MFVHVVDSQGGLLAHVDSQAVGGTRPRSRWTPGEEIQDRHALLLPAERTAGMYAAQTGPCNPATLEGLHPTCPEESAREPGGPCGGGGEVPRVEVGDRSQYSARLLPPRFGLAYNHPPDRQAGKPRRRVSP